MGGTVKPAVIGWDIGQIADPHLIRCGHRELLFEKIRRYGKRMSRIRRPLKLLHLDASDAEILPDLPDSTDTYADPMVRRSDWFFGTFSIRDTSSLISVHQK
jgi:hypothetical protein